MSKRDPSSQDIDFMLGAIPDGVKLAGGVVSLIALVGGASYKIVGGAVEAHQETWKNSDAIVRIESSVEVLNENVENVSIKIDRSTCLLELQMTDSLFTPRQVEARCPSL